MDVDTLYAEQQRLQEANAIEGGVIADRRKKTSNFCFMAFFVVMCLCLLGLAWHLDYVKGDPVLMTMSSVMLQYRCPEVSLVNVVNYECRRDLELTKRQVYDCREDLVYAGGKHTEMESMYNISTVECNRKTSQIQV